MRLDGYPHNVYVFDDFRLEAEKLMLYRGDEEVAMPPKAVETLIALVRRSGTIVSKDDLMDAIWSDAVVEESNLSRYIHMLRSTLGSRPDGRPYIETFRRRGYRFSADVRTRPHAQIEKAMPAQTHDRVSSQRISSTGASTGRVVALADWPRAHDAEPNRETPSASEQVTGETRKPTGRRSWRTTAIVPIILVAIVSVAYALYRVVPAVETTVLTDRDMVLIAEFENKAGDELFDGTLRQGLSIQLAQSPFLTLFPDAAVGDTLKLMNRPEDEKLTREIAREICLRRGLKAFVVGTIARVGDHFALSLETIDSRTGAVLASEFAEAEGKEQVLRSLSVVTASLRRKLGESLASVEKVATPLEVTTSSLEALQAFTVGSAAHRVADYPRAELFFKRAIELDPDFALAYASLGYVYVSTGNRGHARDLATRAYELRDKVSEVERLSIIDTYHTQVTAEREKRIETLELWKSLYPSASAPYFRLGNLYLHDGQYQAAIENSSRAIELDQPRAATFLIRALIALGRYKEAIRAGEEALERGADLTVYREILIEAAFLDGDSGRVERELEALGAQPERSSVPSIRAKMAARAGQLRKADELFREAIGLAEQNESRRRELSHYTDRAKILAAGGRCEEAKAAADFRGSVREKSPLPYLATLVFAACGNRERALFFLNDELTYFPNGTPQSNRTAPLVRALLELNKGNASAAVEHLRPIPPGLELRGEHWVQYTRGRAYLKLERGTEAAAEFQKIIDHPGEAPFSPHYPLAYLGLGRAQVQMGKSEQAAESYRTFFDLWKEADSDLPIVIEARREYARLRASSK